MMDYDPTDAGETPDVRTRDIFGKMDTNNDGVLSKEEFIHGCLSDEKLFSLLACSSEEQQQQQEQEQEQLLEEKWWQWW